MPEDDADASKRVDRRIREIRKGQELNLGQLALLTGISAPVLSLVETGKRAPRLSTLARIASVLRIPLMELLDQALMEAHFGVKERIGDGG